MSETLKGFDWWPVTPSYTSNQPVEEIRAALRKPLGSEPKNCEDITIRLPHEMIAFLEERAIANNHNTLGATIHLMLLEWQCMKNETEELNR